jgi:hypothetical protein
LVATDYDLRQINIAADSVRPEGVNDVQDLLVFSSLEAGMCHFGRLQFFYGGCKS